MINYDKNIYNPTMITDNQENSFRPARLYIKELNGMKYFGKTTTKNIESYSGSGTLWKLRIKKYGKDKIKTIWISEWFHDPLHIQQFALMFSELNQIVESKEWANLRPEDGLAGGSLPGHGKGIKYTEERKQKQKINNAKEEVKRNKSVAQKAIQKEIQNRSEVKKSIRDTFEIPEINAKHRLACKQSWDLIPEKREKRMGANNPSYIHTVYVFEHISGTVEICTKCDLRKKYNLGKSNLYKIIGSNRSCKGWRCKNV